MERSTFMVDRFHFTKQRLLRPHGSNPIARNRASMNRILWITAAYLAAAALAACTQEARPPACCAAPGYSREQVESVLGKPAPPQSSKWHPFPSPPPNAPIYTTEHGYLTVIYSGSKGPAKRFSLDLYEGKAPDDAFHIAAAYLPHDAVDTHAQVVGKKSAIRVYTSVQLAREIPSSRGMLYLECTGANPALLCEEVDVSLGSP